MLTNLKISNFKSIRELNTRLPALTIIVGANSSGKSSILQAILLLVQNSNQLLISSKGTLSIKGSLLDLGLSDSIIFSGANSDKIDISLNFLDGAAADITIDYKEGVNNLNFTRNTDNFKDLSSIFIRYAPALRTGPRQFYSKSGERENEYPVSLNAEEVMSFIDTNRDSLVDEHMLYPRSSNNNLSNQLNDWLSTISSGFQIHTTAADGVDVTKVSFRNSQKGAININSSAPNVGFGLSYILPILTSLLSSKTDDIIILENPEAHIHPEGQMNVGRLISLAASKSDRSLIVETHSDHIINAVRLAVKQGILSTNDVVIINTSLGISEESTFTRLEEIKIDENGKLSTWPEGFFDQYRNALIDLL